MTLKDFSIRGDSSLTLMLAALISVSGKFTSESIEALFKTNAVPFDKKSFEEFIKEENIDVLEKKLISETNTISAPVESIKQAVVQEAPVSDNGAAGAAETLGFEDLF